MDVRIAAKPVNTNSAPTASASSGKASGESFLEILMSGSGVGVQGAATPNGQAQGQSDGESSEGDANGEQKSDANTSQAQASEQAQASATSSTAKGATLNQGADIKATPLPMPAVSLPNPVLLTKLDPAFLLSANGDGATATSTLDTADAATEGKQTGTTQGVRGKGTSTAQGAEKDATQALAASLITIPTAVPQDLTAAQVAATRASAVTALKAPATGADGTATDQSAAQASVDSKPQHKATTQKALDAALALVSDRGAVTATSGKDADGLAAPQGASQEAEQGEQAAQADTSLTALLTPNADIASSTVQTVHSQAASSAANVNQNALHAANALSSALNSSGTTHAASAPSTISAAKGDAQTSDSSSARNEQNGNSSSQHNQATVAPMNLVSAHSTDSAAGQVLTVAATGNAHTVSSSPSTSAPSEGTAHRAAEAAMGSDGANAVSSGGINTARLIQTMSESEMRVGMHSAEFGDISIRTMISQQQVQAQISVNHSELVNALSAHIPSVQAKIGNEYGLHASIEVSQNSASFSNHSGQSSQRDQKPFVASTTVDSVAAPVEMDRLPMRAAAAAVLDGTRLDIRA